MTPAEVQAHPFFQKFTERLQVVINCLVQRGMVSVDESQQIGVAIRQNNPQIWGAIYNLIDRLNMSYSQMNDTQMDQAIYSWLDVIIRTMRASSMNRGLPMGGGGGFGMPQTPPMFGGGGGFGGQGFGFRPGAPVSPFGGNRMGGMFCGGQASTPLTAMLGGGNNNKPQQPGNNNQRSNQPANNAKKANWKNPEQTDSKSFSLKEGVEITATKYTLYNGDLARNVIVYDPKVGYVSDSEVIEKYRPVFTALGPTKKNCMTVFYQRLKAIPVPREEFLKLARTVAEQVGKANGVDAQLRAIISTASHFGKAAYDEFAKLFLDELDAHIQCGELCDSTHPKNILNRPNDLESVLAWVTGEVGKEMVAAMNGMTGFKERLQKLMEVLISEMAAGLYRRILNTKTDMTVIDDFYRALPGMWTSDCGQTFQNTEDLINVFLTTKETIDGSKTANAVRAETELTNQLEALNKQFTLIFVPRIVTWCNYAKSEVVAYDNNGKCKPTVVSRLQPRNDMEFFIKEILEICQNNRDTMLRWTPRNIYFEIEEETYVLQYGLTTDNLLWAGTSKYW